MKCSQCRSNADFYEMVDGVMCPNCLSVNNLELRAIVNGLRTENEGLRSDRDALLCVCSQVGKELMNRVDQLLQAAALKPPAEGEGGGA